MPHGLLAADSLPLVQRLVFDALGLSDNLLTTILWTLTLMLALFVPITALVAMFCIWWERKVAGHMQSRYGPNRVGPIGILQSLADGIKLVLKEDLLPNDADGFLFRLAPYLAFAPVFAAFLALPFGPDFVFEPSLNVGVFWVLAILSIEVMGVILAGWSSNNKWSVFGAMREACQMVSYEIPLGISIIVGVMTAGTLNLVELGHLQSGGLHTWLVHRDPFVFVACFVFFVASLASNKRAPFDLPESESELVAGFHTEYSGLRFSLFFFAEYAAMFVVAGIQVTLFLGAWHDPFGLLGFYEAKFRESVSVGGLLVVNAIAAAIFSAKCIALMFIQMWLRWTLPRPRIDQVLYACMKVLMPLALVLLAGAAFWQLLVPGNPLVPWRMMASGERFNPFSLSQWSAQGATAALITQVVMSIVSVVLLGATVMWVVYAAGFDPTRKLPKRLSEAAAIGPEPEAA